MDLALLPTVRTLAAKASDVIEDIEDVDTSNSDLVGDTNAQMNDIDRNAPNEHDAVS
ncbi:hypothetical protein [Salinimonas chungwhensis]|uniref:hypothetical protein n=1 Tax=Salinimonas chungwhensis TaxID=265425 RepID=UPI0003A1351F|nr:hypothetical protein [Salinimonas chungwhensis]